MTAAAAAAARRLFGFRLQQWVVCLILCQSFFYGSVHAQVVDDEDIGVGTLESLFPTVLDEATSSPTDSPTSPTAMPSLSPSAFASDSPTDLPSVPPTNFPTFSMAPSLSPSETFNPSDRPSVSLEPSVSWAPSIPPSSSPSTLPSVAPSQQPSSEPSISFAPSISFQPSESFAPTESSQPSDFPTQNPSFSPSAVPTISTMPSQQPSFVPSAVPSLSIEPSFAPSVSQQPSLSKVPSSAPSEIPSVAPSLEPSFFPTATPSLIPSVSSAPSIFTTESPTLTAMQGKVVMFLGNLPGELNDLEQEQWVNVTEAHILRYFKDLKAILPGITPVEVFDVYNTSILKQDFPVPLEGGSGSEANYLAIEYTQIIAYNILDETADDDQIRQDLFVAPFEFDGQSYIVDLIEVWDLDVWVDLGDVIVGESDPPTPAPTGPPSRGGASNLSTTAVWAISASIILSAILLVMFLFYDRHRKERLFLQAQEQNRDYSDGIGYSDGIPRDSRDTLDQFTNDSRSATHNSAQYSPTPDRTRTRSARSQSPQRAPSTGISISSRHTRNGSFPSGGGSNHTPNTGVAPPPPMPLPPPRLGFLGNSLTLTPPPPSENYHARHTSNAASEITDITYSDGLGGGRSDTASDESNHNGNNNNNMSNSSAHGNNMQNTSAHSTNVAAPNTSAGLPMLPTITDEQAEKESHWSPLQIDDVVDGAGVDPLENFQGDEDYLNTALDSPTTAGMLGLSSSSIDPTLPSMSGFQMQVEELE